MFLHFCRHLPILPCHRAHLFTLTYLLSSCAVGTYGREESLPSQPVLSLLIRLTSVMLPSVMSFLMVPLRVILGLPRFLLPDGVHTHACLVILVGAMYRTCPKYDHPFLFIVVITSSAFAFSRTSMLVMKSFHLIFRRHQRHFVWNDTSFLSDSLVIVQVSAP